MTVDPPSTWIAARLFASLNGDSVPASVRPLRESTPSAAYATARTPPQQGIGLVELRRSNEPPDDAAFWCRISPLIALTGRTGIGKSSLGNVLMGRKNVFATVAVEEGTDFPQLALVRCACGGGRADSHCNRHDLLGLLDLPGHGGAIHHDRAVRLREKAFLLADVVVHVVGADVRDDVDEFQMGRWLTATARSKLCVALNRCDVRKPRGSEGSPATAEAYKQIEQRRQIVAGIFGLPKNRVIATSAEFQTGVPRLWAALRRTSRSAQAWGATEAARTWPFL